ncbi:MAG TPA: DinB family protein, partial [Acidobacteriota bacterium]|nr:DinB family protein [Acidobacteriota bacterium]
MVETADQYKKRLLSYVEGQELMDVLARTPVRIEELMKSASPEKLQKQTDGRWSAAQILAHYAEGEVVATYRAQMILSVNGVEIQAYDQDLWVGNSGFLIARPELSFDMFRIMRKANLEMLRSLRKEQWDNYGMHSERGKESI